VKDIRRVLDALGADEPELRGEIARIEEIGQTVPLVVRKKLTTLGNP
jgi:ParB-like chromosome segregation protein Spo0J